MSRLPAVLAALLFLLAGCAAPPPREAAPPIAYPAGFPWQDYTDLEAREPGRLWRIVPEDSEILIYVLRGGRLARLGHNHVIASRDVRGLIWLGEDFSTSRADLYFPTGDLIVDDPDMRAAAGPNFDTSPSAADIKGTRANLLGPRVLDVDHYPFVTARAWVESGPPQRPRLSFVVTVKAGSSRQVAPVKLQIADGRLMASGDLTINQTDLGMAPFSVLGGALRVEDTLRLHVRLVARPASHTR